MKRKIIVVALAILSICAVSLVSAMAINNIQQKLISNEVSTSTFLQAPIHLTMNGGFPSQVVAGENYTMNVTIQNIAKKSYSGNIVIEISTDYFYPIPVRIMPGIVIQNSSGSTSCHCPIIVLNNTILTPDMITIYWNNSALTLTSNGFNMLNGSIPMTFPVGYCSNMPLTVMFNDSAPTNTNYHLNVYVTS